MDLSLLETTLADLGEPTFRTQQVWEWASRGVQSYDEMTNVPKRVRDALTAAVPFSTLELVTERESRDGTIKALFRTADGHPVEAVLMRYGSLTQATSSNGKAHRRTLCLSEW